VVVVRCVPAIDLTYGVVLCFGCHDYVYCDEVDMIVQTQRQLAGASLGMSTLVCTSTMLHKYFIWYCSTDAGLQR